MADGRVLAIGASGDPGAVFAALSAAYTVEADPVETVHWTWLDTADWRLHRAGLALREERRGRTRELVLDRPGRPDVTTTITGVRWPSRLERLRSAGLDDDLTRVVGVRALLPVAEVETRRILLRLMDDVGKTRVRVTVEQQRLLSPRRAALPLHVVVRALRGYDRDAQRCVDLLTDAMVAASTDLSSTAAALAAAGHLPEAVAHAHVVAPTDPAVRPVARALLVDAGIVDHTREGAIADLDTEFLHDLRSAIGSTRALLAAAGHLLPGRSAVRVERDLGWLLEMTTPLRAVDLALLEIIGPTGLDATDLADLDPLIDELRRRRRSELRRMRQTLRAPRAPAAFTAWRADLRRMVDADVIGPSAAESARALAGDTFVAVGHADAAELGDRLAAMRAALHAFAGLYPPSVDRVLADLDALRELVRRRDGARFVREQVRAAASPQLPVTTLLSAGALLDRAATYEAELDRELSEGLATFVGRRSSARVAELSR